VLLGSIDVWDASDIGIECGIRRSVMGKRDEGDGMVFDSS